MGDHRAHIKIELEMYGQTRKYDSNCNWVFNGSSLERVTNWLSDTVAELYETVWAVEINESIRRREERDEREQYERLKAKFGDKP